jgi:tetratricopeptide (TPR) repeat protein
LLMIVFPMWCGLLPSQAGGAPAESLSTDAKASVAKAEADVRSAQRALAANPAAEAPVSNLVDALARAGHQAEALVQADRFIKRGTATAALRAQRGFLRRELNDPGGALEDFAAALSGDGLDADQRRNVQAGLTEAQAAETQGALERAQGDLARGEFVRAADEAHQIMATNPDSEAAVRIRIEALTGAGQRPEALAEIDQFLERGSASPLLRAQRGFLRRDQNDAHGAAEDFAAALAGDGLAAGQRRNVEAGLAEAQTADVQGQLNRAEDALKRRDFTAASDESRDALQRNPNSEAVVRVRIETLSRMGRKRDALTEADRFIARYPAGAALRAQRGFLRRELQGTGGAIEDFTAALASDGLSAEQRRNVEKALAESQRAERQRNDARAKMTRKRVSPPQSAEISSRKLLPSKSVQAEDWFKRGYSLLQEGNRPLGADALAKGLELRPVGTAYLDAANAYIFTNAPLASKLYRQGLDRWYAGDPSVAGRPQIELERVKNEVVEADASVRTSASFGGIGGRAEASGGANNMIGAETRMRFDDRYLPAVAGLEAFTRGLSGKDSNGLRETDAAVGLRYRPFRDLNLYIGGAVDHFFQPNSETEFVLNWGLGLGADPYPYLSGWKPYWDFATFGAWRTADRRVLEDVRANAGFLYEFRSPIRGAIGPTLLAVAGYDNQATTFWAAGIGPSVLSYFWLGGDKYRSYDAILSLQIGYLFNIGNDQRQRGWRGQIGVTF